MKVKGKRRSVSCSIKRKKNYLKVPKLIDDPLTFDEARESFKRAFFAKGFKYTTVQVFDSPECPPAKNDPKLEKTSIQTLT
jgi:hypothetical protein